MMLKELLGFFYFMILIDFSLYEGFCSDKVGEVYNDFILVVVYVQVEYDWEYCIGCLF